MFALAFINQLPEYLSLLSQLNCAVFFSASLKKVVAKTGFIFISELGFLTAESLVLTAVITGNYLKTR